MSKQAWIEASAEVEAIERERAALLAPTQERYDAALAKLELIEEESPERYGRCEGCSAPIWEGDRYAYDPESGIHICEECAPTYDDMLKDPVSFVNGDGETMTPEEARAIVDRHVAEGGSLNDKVVSP